MKDSKVKDFLDKNDSIINTTGHVVNFLQNQQIQNNQKVLAEMSAVNASLLDQQNRLKKVELEAIEKLRHEQKKKEDEDKDRQKAKAYLLQITPQMKGLLRLVEENNFEDELQLGLLLNHVEIRLHEISDNMAVIEDINFHDYFFNLNEKFKNLKITHQSSIDKYKNFLKSLANLLLEIRYSISGAELIEKKPEEIYREQNEGAERYLLELYEKIQKELVENEAIDDLIIKLSRFKTLLNYLQEKESILETKRYPLPLSNSEAIHLIDFISEIKNEKDKFLQQIQETVNKYTSIVQDTGDSPFLKLKKISEKEVKNITLDDLKFIKDNRETDHYDIFSETFTLLLKRLSKTLVIDFNAISKLFGVFLTKAGNDQLFVKKHLHLGMESLIFKTGIFQNNFNKNYILEESDKYSYILTLLTVITVLGQLVGGPMMEDGEGLNLIIWFSLGLGGFTLILHSVFKKNRKSLIETERNKVLIEISKYSDILDLSHVINKK